MYLPISDERAMPLTAHSPGGGNAIETETLSGHFRVATLVIGGGIAGTSTALHLAEGGGDVMLVEANEIGWGASSRNAGHVAAATKLSTTEVEQRYGPIYGPRLNEASENGPDLVFGIIERHGIDASPIKSGILIAAHTPAALKTLAAKAQHLQELGRPVRMLDRQEAASFIGSRLYMGAFRDARGGTVNPLAYVRGMARAAIQAGARLHQHSKVQALRRQGASWIAETASGSVTADRVILCTNAYTDSLWPGLRETIVPVRAYQLVTEPLAERIRETVLPGGEPMTDTRKLLSGIRRNPDGRIHFGGIGPIFGRETGPDMKVSVERLFDIFPQAKGTRIEGWWSGWMAMSSANAWQLHQLAAGLTTAMGCNGRGVAIGTILGRELARHALGTPSEDLVVPFTPVKPIPAYRIHQPLVQALVKYYSFRDGIDMRRARKSRDTAGKA